MPGGAQRQRGALVGEQDRRAGVPRCGSAPRRSRRRRSARARATARRAAAAAAAAISARPIASICCWPPLSRPARLVDPLAQDREQLEDLVADAAAPRAANAPRRRFCADGHVREHAPALERLGDAAGDEPGRIGAPRRAAVEADVAADHGAAVVGEQAADGAQQRRLAGAVGAEQRDGLARRGRRARRPRARAPRRRIGPSPPAPRAGPSLSSLWSPGGDEGGNVRPLAGPNLGTGASSSGLVRCRRLTTVRPAVRRCQRRPCRGSASAHDARAAGRD